MLENPLIRFLGGAIALASLPSIEIFGSIEQRPAPAIFMIVLVARIDEILGHDGAEYISGKFMFIYFYLLYLNTLTLYLSSYVSGKSVNISAATWAIVEQALEPRKMFVE